MDTKERRILALIKRKPLVSLSGMLNTFPDMPKSEILIILQRLEKTKWIKAAKNKTFPDEVRFFKYRVIKRKYTQLSLF